MLVVQYLTSERPERWETLDTVRDEPAARRAITQHVLAGHLHAHRAQDGHGTYLVAHVERSTVPPSLAFARRNHPPLEVDPGTTDLGELLRAEPCPDCGHALGWSPRLCSLWCAVCCRAVGLPDALRA